MHTNLFALYRKLHKFAITNSNFEKKKNLDICISIFSKIRSKHKFICKKNRKLHKFAVTNNNFFKSTLSDMHHRKTYMHINFQQNRVSRSVKNRAHKFIWQNIASCKNLQLPIVILKKSILLDMHHHKTYMYIIFSKIRLKHKS